MLIDDVMNFWLDSGGREVESTSPMRREIEYYEFCNLSRITDGISLILTLVNNNHHYNLIMHATVYILVFARILRTASFS